MTVLMNMMYAWDMISTMIKSLKTDFDEDDGDGENHLGLLYLGALLADWVTTFATE